jgi:hypothetical protein
MQSSGVKSIKISVEAFGEPIARSAFGKHEFTPGANDIRRLGLNLFTQHIDFVQLPTTRLTGWLQFYSIS